MPNSHRRAGTSERAAGGGGPAAVQSRSVPSSPHQPSHPRPDRPLSQVVGSADSLVGRVLADQGLAAYCDDPQFVRVASREMQEAMDMTEEQFDRAAHELLLSHTPPPTPR